MAEEEDAKTTPLEPTPEEEEEEDQEGLEDQALEEEQEDQAPEETLSKPLLDDKNQTPNAPPPPIAPLDPRVIQILEETNEYYIQQRIRWGEAITQGCWEQKNIYDVFDVKHNKKIFVIREESNDLSRCCCAPYHSLFARFHLVDEVGVDGNPTPVMTMEREGCDCCGGPCPKPCIGCWACKPEWSDKSVLYAGDFGEEVVPGDQMGAVRDENRLLGATVQPITGGKFQPVLQVMERGAEWDGEEGHLTQFAAARGPCFFGGCSELCCESKFGMSRSKNGMGVDEIHQLPFGDFADITKLKPKTISGMLREGLTDSDIYSIEFKDEATTAQQKANVLATMVLLDYMFFERDNDMCAREGNATSITFFNCFCYGCICPCKLVISDNAGGGGD